VAITGSAGQVLTDPATEAPAQRRRTGKGHIDSYGLDRVCEVSSCATQLSRYNAGSTCWLHAQTMLSASYWTR
jgi:hypothetical protein